MPPLAAATCIHLMLFPKCDRAGAKSGYDTLNNMPTVERKISDYLVLAVTHHAFRDSPMNSTKLP